jgi:endonuclease/exonuclease/phosphatase family metal-dependent hydrolase
MKRLRVVSLNLWGLSLWREVADLCEAECVDVACLQEVDRHYRDRSRWDDVPARAADELGWEWAYAPAIFLPDTTGTRQYGNAVLTRLPLLGRREHALAPEVEWTEPDDSLTEPRILLEAVIEAPWGGLLRIGCTHLADVVNPEDEWIGRRQVADILRVVRDPAWTHVPTVLTGDFNARVGSELLGDLETSLRLVAVEQPHVDHLFISDGLRATEARLLGPCGSDHLPLLCDLVPA